MSTRNRMDPLEKKVEDRLGKALELLLRRFGPQLDSRRLPEAIPAYPAPIAMVDAGEFALVLCWVPVERLKKLTPRELQVGLLIGKGLAYKAIAKRLSISKATVATHLRKIYFKLGIATRGELTRIISLWRPDWSWGDLMA